MEYTRGLMEDNTTENGRMGYSMAKAKKFQNRASKDLLFGIMV